MSVWDAALPKIEALIEDHKRGQHGRAPVTACPSCLFSKR